MNDIMNRPRSVLVMTAVEAEQAAVIRGLGDHVSRIHVKLAGVGAVSAAIETMKAIHQHAYDVVISAGIGGGFIGQAEVGSLVVASDMIAGDYGVESAEGFQSFENLGFGVTRIPADPDLVLRLMQNLSGKTELKATAGPVITVSTATGTAETTAEWNRRLPKVSAEAMEGFGVASAARSCGLPALEIRAISNVVGPRDRSAWKIKEALAVLEQASQALTEVL